MVFLVGCGGAADTKATPGDKHEAEEKHEAHEADEHEVGPDGPADLKVPDLSSIPTDADSVAKGKVVFDQKGCGGCHAFGKKLVGPDLVGITERRTPVWVGKMIQHPEQMTKEDPVAKGLYRSLMVQMTNQGVSDEELPNLIAYVGSQKPQ
jgi:cytochrome c